MSLHIELSPKEFGPKVRATIGALLIVCLGMTIAAAGLVIRTVSSGKTVTVGPVQMKVENTLPTWDMPGDPSSTQIRIVLAASADGQTSRSIRICATSGDKAFVQWDLEPIPLSAGSCTTIGAKGRVEIRNPPGAAPARGTYEVNSSAK